MNMALLKLFNPASSIVRAGIPKIHSVILKRSCHWNMTQNIPKDEELPRYEVCADEKTWQYVERLLPCTHIPDAPKQKYYPSGWKPQKLHANMPYFIQRTKNHMLPIYLRIDHRGMRRCTIIKKIHGNIYELAENLHKFLVKVNRGREICVKVVEVCGRIDIHGDHVSNVKLWLERRNY